MAAYNPDPDPRKEPRPHGGTQPGETPPAESSTSSGAGPYRPPKRGWGRGPLIIIVAVAVLIALFFLVYAIVLAV
ncbi:DUF6480 family protein [Streptomyces sp. NPDC090127]|uniref:DUF6480 family protein n=1 Tax=Streptomyces sp. NPDC090127 TaxID=3365953 RepID=UPI0038189151